MADSAPDPEASIRAAVYAALGITERRGVGRPRREQCRQCLAHVVMAGRLSKRGLCIECAIKNQAMNIRITAATRALARAQVQAETARAEAREFTPTTPVGLLPE